MPRLPHRAALLVATALALAACSQSDTPTGPTADALTSTTAPITPTTTAPPPEAPTPEEEVTAAYLEAVRVLTEAYETSDPDHPGLARTRTDPSLENVRGLLTERREQGVVARFPSGIPTRQVDSVVVRGDFAELNDCFVDDGILVRSSDEQVVDDTITTLSHTVRLRRVSGEWKVEFVEVLRLPDDQTCTEVPS